MEAPELTPASWPRVLSSASVRLRLRLHPGAALPLQPRGLASADLSFAPSGGAGAWPSRVLCALCALRLPPPARPRRGGDAQTKSARSRGRGAPRSPQLCGRGTSRPDICTKCSQGLFTFALARGVSASAERDFSKGRSHPVFEEPRRIRTLRLTGVGVPCSWLVASLLLSGSLSSLILPPSWFFASVFLQFPPSLSSLSLFPFLPLSTSLSPTPALCLCLPISVFTSFSFP